MTRECPCSKVILVFCCLYYFEIILVYLLLCRNSMMWPVKDMFLSLLEQVVDFKKFSLWLRGGVLTCVFVSLGFYLRVVSVDLHLYLEVIV